MLCEHFLAKSFFSLTKKDYGLLIFSNSINIFEKKPIIRTVSMPLKYDIRIWKPYSNGNQLSHLFIWDPKKNCYFVQSKSKNLIQKCAPINTALGVKDCSYESFFVCVPTFAVRETASLGQQMLNAPVDLFKNIYKYGFINIYIFAKLC